MTTHPRKADYQIQFGTLLRSFTKFSNDLQIWYELIDLINEVKFDSSNGPVRITIDWKNAKPFIQKEVEERFIKTDHVRTQEDFDEFIRQFEERLKVAKDEKIQKNLIVDCTVEGVFYNNFTDYLTNLLHQIFLTLNLALPGCCDFYLTRVIPLGDNPDLQERTVRLNSSSLESSIALRDEVKWPNVEKVSVKQAWDWIQALKLNEIQFAQTNTERTIFALLHMCNGEAESPTSLLWLAHALEALYDTPELGISKALRDRIFLVLGKPDENYKRIRQAINKFYSLRSQFVHGDLAISNPMIYEALNTEFNDYADQLYRSFDIAILVILTTLQKLVSNNWVALDFSEQYSGRSI